MTNHPKKAPPSGFFYDSEAGLYVHSSTAMRFIYFSEQTISVGFSDVEMLELEKLLASKGEVLMVDPYFLKSKDVFIPDLLVAIEPVNALLANAFCDDDLHRPEFSDWELIEQPAYMSHVQAESFCLKFGFELPSWEELTVASSAPSKLFKFGALPTNELDLEAILLEKLGRGANRELLGTYYSHWTRSLTLAGDEILLRGGAAELWPWQDSGEWQLCLTCAVWRESANFMETAAVRPVLRL